MPRPRPPRLQRDYDRHGNPRWYVRPEHHGKRIRIRAEFGTPEFDAEYRAAMEGVPLTAGKKDYPSSSLAWLIARYRESAVWQELSPATRRQRDYFLQDAVESAGHVPYSSFSSKVIKRNRDRREKTPHQARNWLDAMRGLFNWAFDKDLIGVNPTVGIANPKRKRNAEGFRVWSEDDLNAYQRHWPLGTRQRVWIDVLLYTGLRRGDAVRLGRQHVRDGVATLKTEKSQYTVEVSLPILPILQKTLDAGPTGDTTYIVGAKGLPLVKESFGNMFKAACKAAGVNAPKQSAHGLRKVAATRAALNGATEFQLMAIFGWTDPKMAAHYVKQANRKKMAAAAIQTLNATATSKPSPVYEVRAKSDKNK